MQSSNNHRYADLAALVFALLIVPVVNIAMLYWQYQLHHSLTRQAGTIVIFLALVLAVLAVSYFPVSWLTKVLRMVAVIVWSCIAYVVSVFIPGCIWAPVCL